jgi:hypothetical protein
MKTRKKLGVLLMAIGMLGTSALALAGPKRESPVKIISEADGTGVAYGQPATARQSTDWYQAIGCVTAWGVNGSRYGTCRATSASGIEASCWTDDADAIAQIRSAQSDSYLLFGWAVDGRCTMVQVETSSTLAPK